LVNCSSLQRKSKQAEIKYLGIDANEDSRMWDDEADDNSLQKLFEKWRVRYDTYSSLGEMVEVSTTMWRKQCQLFITNLATVHYRMNTTPNCWKWHFITGGIYINRKNQWNKEQTKLFYTNIIWNGIQGTWLITCLCCFRFRISSYYFLFRTIQILKTKSVDKPFATSVLAGVCSMMTFRCFPFTFALIWNTSIWLEWLSWAVQKKNARDEKVINRIQSEVTNTAVSGTSLLGEATMA